ncbi:MAG TPA: endopeptidase La [Candidatus Megaira endosymbiont of Hartmannula sinica]|nr:endopeptidase La [Candidatus Megaera endosymbiont of Hartmannula sinica]
MKPKKHNLPLLVLKDIVAFPGTIIPIFISRKKSYNAFITVNENNEDIILLSTQKSYDIDNPKAKDIYDIGIVAKIIQSVTLPNNNAKIIVEIIDKVKITNIKIDNIYQADYEIIENDNIGNIDKITGHIDIILDEAKKLKNKKINKENLSLDNYGPDIILNIISSNLDITIKEKQELLAELNIENKAKLLFNIIIKQVATIETESSLSDRVKKQIEKTQRDFYLNEQMKAIQKELHGDKKNLDEVNKIEEKINRTSLSKEAKEKLYSEVKKLKTIPSISSEYSILRNYIDTILSLPWNRKTNKPNDIIQSEEILNKGHYGLEKVKERITEYLAVIKRSNKIKSPILCFIGPPGVGKTSLVKSIAEAVGRKYCKFSLGGVKDEAEIRGHRKTYLGAMPGKIINLLRKIKSNNPVMLLDEIDKMSSDFKGDPSSAMLEVLDPEQNNQFNDHYLEIEFDLSNIIFIATANSYNIPRPLLDRMEIIDLSSYMEEEKVQIALNYLIPKQKKEHQVKEEEFSIDQEAILKIIRNYTREAGVRSLEREIAKIIRKALTRILKDKNLEKISVSSNDLTEYLGKPKYRFGIAKIENQIGATTGLAYTEVGGDILEIEAVKIQEGKGLVKSTGKLGEVMKESVETAYSCVMNNSKDLNINVKDCKKFDIHLHVPEGAVPKDGPSAGIAIYTTIASLLMNKPVYKDIAMTGEITLKGQVLPIGGLKEKLLAAKRGGIKKALIPQDNIKDLEEIPENIKKHLDIKAVSKISEVIKEAIVT